MQFLTAREETTRVGGRPSASGLRAIGLTSLDFIGRAARGRRPVLACVQLSRYS